MESLFTVSEECSSTEYDEYEICTACDGTGEVEDIAIGPDGEDVVIITTCMVCGGTGKISRQ